MRWLVDSVRFGAWLDRARLRRIGLVLGIGYAASWVFLLAGTGAFDPMGRPVGTDFALFYGVSRAVLSGVAPESLYAPQVLNDAIRDVTGGAEYVWMYPPTALIMCWPLATLSYFGALMLWTGVGILAYLAVTWRVLRAQSALVAALLSPALYCCVVNGHNGLLTASLVGAAAVLLPTRPAAAGALFGAVAVLKPHLVLLVPIALLASRRWLTLCAMVGTIVILAVVAASTFGLESWGAFLRSAPLSRAVLEAEGVPYAKLASAFSSARLLGLSNPVAYVAQGAVSVAAIGVTAWVWARPRSHDVQVAALLLAGALATPYLYDYDLPAMGVGLTFWARAATRSGWRPWEKSAVFLAWFVPILTRPVAMAARLGVLPIVLIVVLALLVRRATGDAIMTERPILDTGSKLDVL